MANKFPNWDNYTRQHWAGEAADIDIHLEQYQGVIDGSWNYHSMFRSNNWAEKIKLKDTNTYRWDRFGGTVAYGRSPGEELEETRVVNEKVTTVIERAIYTRTPLDRQDDWTSPDRTKRIGEEQGKALARAYDRAGTTKLIHATEWEAPKSLKDSGAFYDGVNRTMADFSAETDMTAKADMIEQYHRQFIVDAQRRDQGSMLGEFITLIAPEWFNILMDHNKLLNQDFSQGNGSFANRRIAQLNGITLIEAPILDFQEVPADHPTLNQYGAEFERTAEQAKTGLIFFNPKHTLLEIEAKGITTNQFELPKEWTRMIESYYMSKFEIRRGDAAYGLRSD